MKVDEAKILKQIQIVDKRLADGKAKILSMEEVQKRLKARREAIKVEVVDIVPIN